MDQGSARRVPGTADARSRSVVRTTPSALLAIAVLGCQIGKEPEPEPAPRQYEHDRIVRLHMHENFNLLRAIEKLLIRGKLEEATMLARAISEAPDEPALGRWAPHAMRVRELAAALARAPNTDEALRREARLAVACAGCHEETGVVLELGAVPPLPPDQPTIEARMARHLWATDRLWEATISGAMEPWTKGLDVLAASPLPFRDSLDDRAGLARKLQQLADQARTGKALDSLAERGRAYGEILTVCASCHTTTVVPKLPSER